MGLSRHYVWQCDYGNRTPVIPVFKILLDEQDYSQLESLQLYINNNPYNLEFYTVLTYANPIEGQIERMKNLMVNAGVRYRPDITMDELFKELAHRRFNVITIPDSQFVEMIMDSCFQFVDRDTASEIISMRPLGNKTPVFLSHATRNKTEIEDLIPYLNGAGLPIWFDKVNIDYGQSIINEVQKGIKNSGAVIFWITREFLGSNWCNTELEGFLTRLAGKNNILVISVVDENVEHEELPLLLQGRKYLKKKGNMFLEQIAREIIPTLRDYLKISTFAD